MLTPCQTFAATEVLRLLALIVAAAGMVAGFASVQFVRARLFATLRVLGLTRLDVARVVAVVAVVAVVSSRGLVTEPRRPDVVPFRWSRRPTAWT